MIAGIPTDHLPGFERSVNAAIRCALVGGSCPPANRPFYQSRFAGEQRRPQEAIQNTAIISKFLDTSGLQSAFGTGAAVPTILITTVLQDNITKTSQDRPYQN
jgi:biotin synthase-related radical SAM superfamily protein